MRDVIKIHTDSTWVVVICCTFTVIHICLAWTFLLYLGTCFYFLASHSGFLMQKRGRWELSLWPDVLQVCVHDVLVDTVTHSFTSMSFSRPSPLPPSILALSSTTPSIISLLLSSINHSLMLPSIFPMIYQFLPLLSTKISLVSPFCLSWLSTNALCDFPSISQTVSSPLLSLLEFPLFELYVSLRLFSLGSSYLIFALLSFSITKM